MTVAIDDAMSGVVISPRVQEIIDHERAAVDHQTKSDEHRWEAARLITEEIASGTSGIAIAKQIGKTDTHVYRMRKCWLYRLDQTGSQDTQPGFWQLYNSPEIKGAGAVSGQSWESRKKRVDAETQPEPPASPPEPRPAEQQQHKPAPTRIPTADDDPWLYVVATLETAQRSKNTQPNEAYRNKLVRLVKWANTVLETEQ